MADPFVLPEFLIGCAQTHMELQHASGRGPLAVLRIL